MSSTCEGVPERTREGAGEGRAAQEGTGNGCFGGGSGGSMGRGGKGRDFFPRSPAPTPPPPEAGCQAPGPLQGAPRPGLCQGTPYRAHSSHAGKAPYPATLGWGSEPLGAEYNQVGGRVHGGIRKPLRSQPTTSQLVQTQPGSPSPTRALGAVKPLNCHPDPYLGPSQPAGGQGPGHVVWLPCPPSRGAVRRHPGWPGGWQPHLERLSMGLVPREGDLWQ